MGSTVDQGQGPGTRRRTWDTRPDQQDHHTEIGMTGDTQSGCRTPETAMFSSRSAKDCQERNAELCLENSVVQPLLTDLYQITMAYAYWKSGKINDVATLDLFFRKNPFKGEFTIFAGLSDCLKFLENFHYSETDISYLRTVLPESVEDEFFQFLQQLSPKDVTVCALSEGSVCFPRIPLMRITGPLIVVQLLETTFLTLVNYSSLITTNAARFRIAAGKNISLLEFGLRRAQGPDGGLSASRYAYIGGFDGTSNVLAGKLFSIPVKGTHAHAFVTSFTGVEEVKHRDLERNSESLPNGDIHTENGEGKSKDFVSRCEDWRNQLGEDLNILASEAHDGEFAAFISYAIAFPKTFTALIDTYDVARSGVLNFCAVALSLHSLGYLPLGV